MSVAGQRHFRVTITGSNAFRKIINRLSGGGKQADFRKAYNGGAATPDLIAGRPQIDNIVCSWWYDSKVDRPGMDFNLKKVGTDYTYTVTKQDLDGNGVALGKPTVYSGCKLVRMQVPEYDEESSEPAQISMEFMPQSVT